ncbi:18877_t:CDS:2, partial [Racocetra fulgida]
MQQCTNDNGKPFMDFVAQKDGQIKSKMAPTREINIQLKPNDQVVEVVKHLTYDSLYKPDDVVLITVTCEPKARVQVATIS